MASRDGISHSDAISDTCTSFKGNNEIQLCHDNEVQANTIAPGRKKERVCARVCACACVCVMPDASTHESSCIKGHHKLRKEQTHPQQLLIVRLQDIHARQHKEVGGLRHVQHRSAC